LVQSVAATFLEVMPRFEGRYSVRTFLFGIMRRKAAEMRRVARRTGRDDTALDGAAFDTDGESRLERAELGQVIHECIDQLPQQQRAAALLRFKHEQESEEVGDELGVSTNYLGVLIHRARQHLRDCIGRHGFTP
jgi:RNA polymerase sigma-70 factor (ECF subfamily)